MRGASKGKLTAGGLFAAMVVMAPAYGRADSGTAFEAQQLAARALVMQAKGLGAKLQAERSLLAAPDAPGASGPSAQDRATLRAASAAYYSLAKTGFNGFKADLEVDWAVVLGRPLNERQREMFDGLKFQISVDGRGVATVTSAGSVVTDDLKVAFDGLRGGLQQAMDGVFDVWSIFMIRQPLPSPEGEFRLAREGELYQVSFKAGPDDVSTTMRKNFAATKIEFVDPQLKSVIKPGLTATKEGFVLSSYESTSEPADQTPATWVKAAIDYQEAAGFRLPKKITADCISAGERQPRFILSFKNVSAQRLGQ